MKNLISHAFSCRVKIARHFLMCCMFTSFVTFVPAIAQNTSIEQCERWIKSAPFASREGLLQMFLQAAITDNITRAYLDSETLAQLNEKLETMFPLDEAESVEYADSILTLRFKHPVNVKVPGTWRQADLAMSKEVKFRVRPLPNGGSGIEFQILQGSVDLSFGWLARKITGMPAKLHGKYLRYWSVDAHKVSKISLTQETSFAHGKYNMEYTPGNLRVKAPNLDPMVFTDSTADYMGIKLAWRGVDSLYTPDGKWVQDSAAVNQFRNLSASLMAAVDSTGGQPTLYLTDELGYQLEERKGSLSKGFRLAK